LYDFGAKLINTFSEYKTFTVSNAGSEDIVINSISLTGEDSSEFSLNNETCSEKVLKPEEKCIANIIFSPISEGVKSANLSLSSAEPANLELNVKLTGTAVDYQYLSCAIKKLNVITNTKIAHKDKLKMILTDCESLNNAVDILSTLPFHIFLKADNQIIYETTIPGKQFVGIGFKNIHRYRDKSSEKKKITLLSLKDKIRIKISKTEIGQLYYPYNVNQMKATVVVGSHSYEISANCKVKYSQRRIKYKCK
jgi:hypothetical protein